MKVVFLTTTTPASENIRGGSAHPYHLIAERSKDMEVVVYSFNNNALSDEKIRSVEKELGVSIHIVAQPWWFRMMFKCHLMFIRLFLRYPFFYYIKLPRNIVTEIKQWKPDVVWVYGTEFSRMVNQFDGYRRVHTMPDSVALYYYRMLGLRFVTHSSKTFWKCAFMYPKYLRLERNYSIDPSIHYHLVGKADAEFLKKMNPDIQAHFIHHPHYELKYKDCSVKKVFHSPKIRVVLAGQYNYYMKQDADLWCKELEENADTLKDSFSITFLGREWENHADSLKKVGYEVGHIAFAPDYIEEISKHDIQITPISIGTGTKGKVLDALANGLLVIGTWYALENIAVEDGVSCICCDEAHKLPQILSDIAADPSHYERMAQAGREAVLTLHGRKRVARKLFSLFDKCPICFI